MRVAGGTVRPADSGRADCALGCVSKGFSHEVGRFVHRRLVAAGHSLFQVGGALDRDCAADRRHRADIRRGRLRSAVQRVEPALLRQHTEQGRGHFLARDHSLLRAGRRVHRRLCRARHRQPLSAPALAALADAPLSRPLAGRSRLLPHRAAAHGRQRRPAHRRGPAPARRVHDDQLLLGLLGAIATLVSFLLHPVDAVGTAVAGRDRSRRHHSGLHGVGMRWSMP